MMEEEKEEEESVSTGEGGVLEENISAKVSKEESVSGVSGVVEDPSPPSSGIFRRGNNAIVRPTTVRSTR